MTKRDQAQLTKQIKDAIREGDREYAEICDGYWRGKIPRDEAQARAADVLSEKVCRPIMAAIVGRVVRNCVEAAVKTLAKEPGMTPDRLREIKEFKTALKEAKAQCQ